MRGRYRKRLYQSVVKAIGIKIWRVAGFGAMERVLHMSTPEIMVCIEQILTAERLEDVLLKAQKD
jgi:hypothetical protein